MSAETFTTALFLITAVIAAGVLINAVFPVVYNMAGTFQSSTHDADTRLRTDFKIVATFAPTSNPGTADIYMKNIGSQRIPIADIEHSDVFFGKVGNFGRLAYQYVNPPTGLGQNNWTEVFDGTYDISPPNGDWDPGETLRVSVKISDSLIKYDSVYFQFILPNGIWRSNEFTVS